MQTLISVLLFLSLSSPALAAKKKDYWLKVETTEEKKTNLNKPTYPYDSLESPNHNKKFREIGFWSLRPKLLLSGGFLADRFVFEKGKTNRYFAQGGIQFRTRPTHRLNIQALMLQNNSLMVSGAWEYTPSRKARRFYYGLGAAHQLIAEKEFSNLVDSDSYFVTAQAGYEHLLRSQRGLFAEAKVYLGLSNYALQLTLGYIIPL